MTITCADLDEDGLCKRCAGIDWKGMAHAIDTYPIRHTTINNPFHVFDMDTKVTDPEEVLKASSCRFCQLLGKAVTVHSLVVPGPLECVHDGSSMTSIHMDSMVPALALTLNDAHKAERMFFQEYANVKKVDYKSIKHSIDACDKAHPRCTPDLLNDLPGFRLIDCKTRMVVSAKSTIHTVSQGKPTQKYRYVALSYVWGPKPDESRTSASGVLENLPRTIDDSIQVCKGLGHRYLWVDRYCIDQKNLEEKRIQIANMGKIYSSAQLTIIASVGEDPSYGLPGLGAKEEDTPFEYETIKRLTVIVRPLDPNISITASKWATRGWTYQEGYLSRRRIFFTNKSIRYICNSTVVTVNGDLHRFLPRASQRSTTPKAYSEVTDWTARLVGFTRNLEAYSARQLSVDGDALDAITGALQDQMTKEIPVHNLWGVPIFETDIDYDLSPSKKFSKGKLKDGLRDYKSIEFLLHWRHSRPRRRRPGFPSWSFLGWVGRVNYLNWPRQTHIGENFNVHNLQATGRNTFALTPAATLYLDVTTFTIPFALVDVKYPEDATKNGYYLVAALDDTTEAFVELPLVHWSRDPAGIHRNKTPLTGALFIDERKLLKEASSTTTLILQKLGNHYERMGVCTIVSLGLNTLQTPVRTVTGASMTVKNWEPRDVRMQEWQQRAKRERILIG